MTSLHVVVFADVVCPWCFIGLRRLVRALAAAGVDGIVTHQPFLLDPATPPEGIDVPAMLRRKYHADPARLFAKAEAEAKEAGIDLDLSKQPPQRPTIDAHTLLRHAEERGTQAALLDALYVAHFLDRVNVADRDVLASIASQHGFTVDDVNVLLTDESERMRTHAAAAAAVQAGVEGVPFFVLNGKLAMSGAQPTSVFDEAIERATR